MEPTLTKILEPNVTIKGNGSSLWADTKDVKYNASKVVLSIHPWTVIEDKKRSRNDVRGEINITVGRVDDWTAYTDRAVEKQVVALVKKTFPELEFEYIGWSEQGMQGKGRWNFDFGFTAKTSYEVRYA